MKSGLKAAGEEFVYGVYDGWTGLVKQPYSGAKAGGAKGFAKGLGRGVGGWVLKDIGAVVGPIGYTLKGVQKQFSKSQKHPDEYIEEARKIQGRKDYAELDESQKIQINEAVADAWRTIANVKRREDDMRTKEHRRVVEKHKKPRKSTMNHSKSLAMKRAGRKGAEPTGEEASTQTNGTIVASDLTGTDVQDLATDTGPPAAEALVNSAIPPGRLTKNGAQNNSPARDSGTGTPSETQPGWAKEVAARILDTPATERGSEPQAAQSLSSAN